MRREIDDVTKILIVSLLASGAFALGMGLGYLADKAGIIPKEWEEWVINYSVQTVYTSSNSNVYYTYCTYKKINRNTTVVNCTYTYPLSYCYHRGGGLGFNPYWWAIASPHTRALWVMGM